MTCASCIGRSNNGPTARSRRTLAGAAALLALTGLIAVANSAGTPSDQALSDAVEDELLYDPVAPAARIDITTRDGIVTLEGEVNDLLARQRSQRLAETVRGVRAVVNRIRVNPRWDLTDAEIAHDVRVALRRDPAADSYQIDVDVEDGAVALHGVVDSWQEKHLATLVAQGVRGVRLVDNRIAVQHGVVRTDEEIRADVERTLLWDALVDGESIDVDVQQGRVYLSGSVGSAAEKRIAREDAWAAGVKDVDTRMLEVRSRSEQGPLRRDRFAVRSDDEIERAVVDALAYDPRVNRMDVNVEVSGGKVTLRGAVGDLKAKLAAGADARNTVGVRSVKNRLRIRLSRGFTDGSVRTNVREAFERDPMLTDEHVRIQVRNGSAILSGVVDSYLERAWASDVTARVKGVVSVDNNLSVASGTAGVQQNPYVDEWAVLDYQYRIYQPAKRTRLPDDQIRRAIEARMKWCPFVRRSQVEVEVEQGVAILKGSVQSRIEQLSARECALEGGAAWVRDELNVTTP